MVFVSRAINRTPMLRQLLICTPTGNGWNSFLRRLAKQSRNTTALKPWPGVISPFSNHCRREKHLNGPFGSVLDQSSVHPLLFNSCSDSEFFAKRGVFLSAFDQFLDYEILVAKNLCPI